MRVAVCTNMLSPYRIPVFRALAEDHDWDLRVFVDADREADRHWTIDPGTRQGFEVERVRTLTRRRRFRVHEPVVFDQIIERHWPVDLALRLRRWKPDVIIGGEIGPRSWMARAAAASMQVPFVLWAYQSRAGASAWTRHPFLRRRLVRSSHAIVGMGVQAREALLALGADPCRVFDAPNAADIERIVERRRSQEHRRRRLAIRAEAGGRRRAVVVGRLVPMKGIDRILAAWSLMGSEYRDAWRLTFVGDGPLRPMVDRCAESNPGVEAVGHVATGEVPDWIAASDLHLFPTLGDPWGLVVNEAMHCGVPTACSIHSGCFDDIAGLGGGTLPIDPTQRTEVFARELESILGRDDLASHGRDAGRFGRTLTPGRMATAFAGAVAFAADRGVAAGDAFGGAACLR